MYFDQITEGQTWKWEITITPKVIDDVAMVFSDYNPVHMEHDAAVNGGFETRIFHGVGLVGFISAGIANELPGPGSVLLKIHSSFVKPAYEGDDLSLELVVVKKYRSNSTVNLSYLILNARHERLAFCSASVLVPSKVG